MLGGAGGRGGGGGGGGRKIEVRVLPGSRGLMVALATLQHRSDKEGSGVGFSVLGFWVLGLEMHLEALRVCRMPGGLQASKAWDLVGCVGPCGLQWSKGFGFGLLGPGKVQQTASKS